MPKFFEPFCRVDRDFKSYVEKLIHILGFIPWKTTESMGYDVVWSYEYLISPETTFMSAQEDVDELVLQEPTYNFVLDNAFE